MKKLISTTLMIAIISTMVFCQTEKVDSTYRRHFIGSSLFVLFNVFEKPSPSFYQLNYGYSLSPKDVLIVEAITWTYNSPLGIPFGDSFDDPEKAYPGYIREFGIGLAYKRFIWKDFYSTFHATPLLRHYLDLDKKNIQNGFQLFLTLRFGYHFRLFNDRFFLEPSIAFTHWPINTNVPESFAAMEKEWPKYFLFEPGFHFGFKF